MQRDIVRQVTDQYEAAPPILAPTSSPTVAIIKLAQDATPAADLVARMRDLRSTWERRFDELSHFMARHFAKSVADRTDGAMKAALRKAGFSVRLQVTPAQQEIITAAVAENVNLIKSIPAQHFTQIEGSVLRSVAKGGDLHTLTKELQANYGVTRRRAATIAMQQNKAATASLERARQMELGLQAVWLHSAGGKHPRRSHVANSGKPYDVKTGWFDPDEKVYCWPGTLISCRCVSRSIVFPGRFMAVAA